MLHSVTVFPRGHVLPRGHTNNRKSYDGEETAKLSNGK